MPYVEILCYLSEVVVIFVLFWEKQKEKNPLINGIDVVCAIVKPVQTHLLFGGKKGNQREEEKSAALNKNVLLEKIASQMNVWLSCQHTEW